MGSKIRSKIGSKIGSIFGGDSSGLKEASQDIDRWRGENGAKDQS